MFKNKRIILLCSHVDDGEYGAGGTTVRAVEEGAQVYYVSFSYAEKSLKSGFSLGDIKKECTASNKILGTYREINYDFEVRLFSAERQTILEEMVSLANNIKPDIVFTPSTYDTHQDHQVICEESFRAFKRCSILGYEMIQNNREFSGSFFVELCDRHVKTQLLALDCYKSQKIKKNGDTDFLVHLARTRGTQIYREYAECFEVIRLINNL